LLDFENKQISRGLKEHEKKRCNGYGFSHSTRICYCNRDFFVIWEASFPAFLSVDQFRRKYIYCKNIFSCYSRTTITMTEAKCYLLTRSFFTAEKFPARNWQK
jgi:hypothetical protein